LSSEAEFVALSEAVKEIKFVVQVLESIGVKVKFPIMCELTMWEQYLWPRM